MKKETEFKKAFRKILTMDYHKVSTSTSRELGIELGVSTPIANFAKQAFEVIKEEK